MKFTASYNAHTRSVPFLDMEISFDHNGYIVTDLFKKATSVVQYLLPSSCHPGHICKNIPYSLAYRLLRICTEKETFLSRLEELRQDLLSRHYPAKIIQDAFERVKLIPRAEALKKVEKKTSDREPLVVTYHPSLISVSQTVKKHWQVMTSQCPRLKRCFSKPSVVAYKRSKSIGDKLFRAKIKIKRTSTRRVNGFSVCKQLCMTCPMTGLNPGQKVKKHTCHKTGETWNITSALDCQSSNVIYRITCKKCKFFVYIGMTTRKLCQRMNDHRGYIRRNEDTATGRHFNLKGHSIADLQVVAIERVSPAGDQELIELRESLWISRYDSVTFGANTRE